MEPRHIALGVAAFGVGVLVGRKLSASPVTVGLSVSSSNEGVPFAENDPFVIYATQRRLAFLGYAPGALDGILSVPTIQALQLFQANELLPVTGRVDRITATRVRDAAVALDREVIAPRIGRIAAALGALGYSTQGSLGASIIPFQVREGLPVLGQPDAPLLDRLATRTVERGVTLGPIPPVPFVLKRDNPEASDRPVVPARHPVVRVAYDASRPYRLGDEGSGGVSGLLRSVQDRLNGMGFGPISTDGRMGPATAEAVAQAQVFFGVTPVDGKPGPATRRALYLA